MNPMLPKFEKSYRATANEVCPCCEDSFSDWEIPSDLRAFFDRFEGSTFCQGLYRIPCKQDFGRVMLQAGSMFPHLKARILCFGIDWLGRIFALDKFRSNSGKAQVLRLDAGFAEAMEIPLGLIDLHESEFIDYPNDALSKEFYESWRLKSDQTLLLSQCVGYKILPTLGGRDVVDNLEVTDRDVYWTLCAQINLKTSKVPDGTVIGQVGIK